MLHTESLFFVDHQQAEILVSHRIAQQAVRADHHIDITRRERAYHAARLRVGHESRQQLHPHRERLQSLGERCHVL